jgi:hypothetical protein
MTRNRAAGLLILAIVLAFGVWFGLMAHKTPAGQPPLAGMNLETLKAEFNRASDRVRVIVLLSPT